MALDTTPRRSAALPILQANLGDRYRLVRELGRGGMASVYLAEDLKHGRLVALKVLRPELCEPHFVARFQREIRAVARLHHTHILPLHDSGEAAGLLYYVMPYVEGETLRERLQRERALSWGEIVRITSEVAEALDHAHRHGFVHRDVKPENVLLEEGHVRLADFGVAIATDPAAGPRLTAAGLLVGTPNYMSPEQALDGARVDGRSDVYSLACMVFEMIAGEPLFSGVTPHQVMARRFQQPRPPLDRLPGGVPRPVHQTLERALAEHPDERYATAGDFANALARSLRAGWGTRLRTALAGLVTEVRRA